MSINFSAELKRHFDSASLLQVAKRDLNDREWREYQHINKTHNQYRRQEQTQFEDQYDLRVDVARRGLIDKAASKTKTLKHRWFGHDNFDKNTIEQRAHQHVVFKHHQQLAAIDGRENEAIRQLLERCDKRVQQREQLNNDFTKTADRRQITDRRAATPPNDPSPPSSARPLVRQRRR